MVPFLSDICQTEAIWSLRPSFPRPRSEGYEEGSLGKFFFIFSKFKTSQTFLVLLRLNAPVNNVSVMSERSHRLVAYWVSPVLLGE